MNDKPAASLVLSIEKKVFLNRRLLIILFALITILMLYLVSHLRVDAGFNKLLPLEHEYMQTFLQYQAEFGGANRILIAIMSKQGDIFTPAFFDVLKQKTDEVFFINGVDRTKVKSLFTPNVRYTEVVEDGIAGGNVIPDDFQNTPVGLALVKQNIIKAGIVGKLVANDFSGALISAQLLEIDPDTGKKLDYFQVAKQLEKTIRQNNQNADISIHIIGFAKVIGDVTAGTKYVLVFFFIAFVITAILVVYYAQSFRLALLPILCSLIAVIWQLGMLPILGFGIDPMSILVPFLIFAIGVSHGVQMLSSFRADYYLGANSLKAAQASFRVLFVPGMIALISDCVGFITIMLIDIQIIQEMAITASVGIAMIILTNLFLLPILLSYQVPTDDYKQRLNDRADQFSHLWRTLAAISRRQLAIPILLLSVILFCYCLLVAQDVKIGDLHQGVPELHSDSRYNLDSDTIARHFSIGVDVITVIAESKAQACVDYDIMSHIDQFAWYIQNTPNVQSVVTLPMLVKRINSGWNEGSLKWRVIPRDPSLLAQSVAYVPTSSGLLNSDCSVMPIIIFTKDHKAETIQAITDRVKHYRDEHPHHQVNYRLATGNVGVMAATNEEVKSVQFPILVYVYAVVTLLCFLTFRSLVATISIIYPLALVSVMAYTLMVWFEIGLKVNTLPVVALGVGIGVDYGIYIFSRLRHYLGQGLDIQHACLDTFSSTGFSVIFTGITLSVGVITWVFSPLKFQADMGLLLGFMFMLNMLAAIILIPAINSVLTRIK